MVNISTVCVILVLICTVDSRRPRAASPQSRRALPGLQLPTAEDLVGALVPSRWKWPRYPEKRWNPYLQKKPTGLQKKKKTYPKKFLGPKFQKPSRPPVKARLAPVTNLRPKSIDRIDILRPQLQPGVAERFTPSFSNLSTVNTVQIGAKQEKAKGEVLEDKQKPASSASTTTSTIEVDGIKIYMFRGDEGIGGYKPVQKVNYKPNQILPQATISNKNIQWSKSELKPRKVQKPQTINITPTESPYQPSLHSTPRDIAPPFPTRHTTKAPNHERQPIVIIAQSNVAQN